MQIAVSGVVIRPSPHGCCRSRERSLVPVITDGLTHYSRPPKNSALVR
jgi:hypothetical protein